MAARVAHNHEADGSNPSSATIFMLGMPSPSGSWFPSRPSANYPENKEYSVPQDVINLIISGVAGVFGWLMRIVWETQKQMQQENRDLAEKVNSIEVLVAGQYVRRDELAGVLNRIDHKLDAISEKLDTKVDK